MHEKKERENSHLSHPESVGNFCYFSTGHKDGWGGLFVFFLIFWLNFSCSCPFHLVENLGPCSNDMVNFYGNRPSVSFASGEQNIIWTRVSPPPQKKKPRWWLGPNESCPFFHIFPHSPFLMSRSFKRKLLFGVKAAGGTGGLCRPLKGNRKEVFSPPALDLPGHELHQPLVEKAPWRKKKNFWGTRNFLLCSLSTLLGLNASKAPQRPRCRADALQSGLDPAWRAQHIRDAAAKMAKAYKNIVDFSFDPWPQDVIRPTERTWRKDLTHPFLQPNCVSVCPYLDQVHPGLSAP